MDVGRVTHSNARSCLCLPLLSVTWYRSSCRLLLQLLLWLCRPFLHFYLHISASTIVWFHGFHTYLCPNCWVSNSIVLYFRVATCTELPKIMSFTTHCHSCLVLGHSSDTKDPELLPISRCDGNYNYCYIRCLHALMRHDDIARSVRTKWIRTSYTWWHGAARPLSSHA